MNQIDIGQFRRKQVAKLEAAAIYRAAATSSDVGLLVQAMDGTILWANAAYGRMMGYTPEEVIGLHPLAFAIPPENRPSAEEIAKFRYVKPTDGKPWIEVARNIRRDGSTFWIEMHVAFTRLRGKDEVAILVGRDISDHVERRHQIESNADELRRLALTDSLTGLANRYALMQDIYDLWDAKTEQHQQTSILYIDVDRLRQVNDIAGQSAGDHVLQEVANRLKSQIGAYDLLARSGGDEFIVLCRSATTENELATFCENMMQAVQGPIRFRSATFRASISIGAAIAIDLSKGPETLLKRANFALKSAKEKGNGQLAIYDQNLHNRRIAEDTLAEELQSAIENGELIFHFQPTMRMDNGNIQSFETLVRWNNPRLGMVPPITFLPVARKIGLMADIDLAALDAALKMICRLKEAGFDKVRIGINGSEEFLSLENFNERFFFELESHGVDPSAIAVEVLETVVFDDMTQSNPLVQVVQTLHDRGVTVLLDDFGTGHAGLTHLAKLAVTGVKIDRSLTENILTDHSSAKIVGMMHDLCTGLGIYVVTEGVETKDQARCLRSLGGTYLQGYWLAKPMPAEDVIPWLKHHPNLMSEIQEQAIAAT